MRKILYTFLTVLVITGMTYPQVTTLWEKSAANTTLPAWFSPSGNTERGIGYGLVGANHRLFIPTRNSVVGGKQVYIYNAVTGDSVGFLDTTGISGGTFVVNDAEVSSNGIIFVCNLTTGANTSPFKVYRYDTETSVPVAVINYTDTAAVRLGDKFTVTGSTADNSIIIWAAAANKQEVYKFTTTDNGLTFSAERLPITGLTTLGLGSASVGPLPDGKFYWNAGGYNPKKYNADGTVIGTIPGTVVATGSNAIRFMGSITGDEYVATYAYGSTNETGRIVKVAGGVPEQAVLFGVTNILGTNSNGGGTGDLAVRKINNLTYHVYVLGTNNGFGAYKVYIQPSLAGTYYIGAPGTGPGGTDPHFADLRSAFEVLNDAVFTDNCTFYITSNITETYPSASYGLGLAINPEPYTVTFKPYTGIQPVITLPYPGDLTSGPSGALVIGLPSKGNVAWDSMKVTRNIIIDGSNTVDGTTRDLTIENQTTSQRNGFPMTIVGDVANLVIKNTNIYYKAQGVSTSGNLFVSAVQLRSRNYLAKNWVPNNILLENNHISANFPGVAQSSQGYGTYQSGTPLPADYPYNITLKNNVIEGKRRAVTLYRAGSHNIEGNEIILNQDIAANLL
jgi:hypothetical protein